MKSPPPTEALDAAVAAIVRCPVRWSEAGDHGEHANRAVARGWFHGAHECARHIAQVTSTEISSTGGFGGTWPVVAGVGWIMAPAMPVALVGSTGEGADAVYSRREDEVLREAAGREDLFLARQDECAPPGRPFDLLWFGDSARFSVRSGRLEIEDVFSRLQLAVDLGFLERELVRRRRLEARVLEGLECSEGDEPATMTVHRAAALYAGEDWRDPERLLTARADIKHTERRGGSIVARTEHGTRVLFECQERSDGWRLVLREGDSTCTALELRRDGGWLALAATLHPGLDALRPGMRGRLAFDLLSDLVALGDV